MSLESRKIFPEEANILSLETLRVAGCEGKVKYRDRSIAERVAKKRKKLHAYKCEFCGEYHIGRSMKG